jgi:pantetheine-phosphate adenylyltransferase
MREHEIERIVKGYRNDVDLAWEREQAEYNMKHGGYDTELILCDEKFTHVSSSLVREKLKNGESLEGLLPACVENYIQSLD